MATPVPPNNDLSELAAAALNGVHNFAHAYITAQVQGQLEGFNSQLKRLADSVATLAKSITTKEDAELIRKDIADVRDDITDARDDIAKIVVYNDKIRALNLARSKYHLPMWFSDMNGMA